jgi:hypothetical protein
MKLKNKLTERERKIFEYLVGGVENLAITHMKFNGEQTSCIAFLNQDEDGAYEIVPLAILVDERLFSRLVPVYTEDDETDETTILKLKRK